MAIDSAQKRRSAAGINRRHPGVTPNASKGQLWRQEAGRGYSGILTGDVAAPTYSSEGTAWIYNSTNMLATSWYLEVDMRALVGSAYARLLDDSLGTVVTNSTITTATQVFGLVRSPALAMGFPNGLITGNTYRAQFGSDGSDAGEAIGAKLIGIS